VKYLLMGLAFLLLTGCVSIKVVKPDGTKMSYFRWGRQGLEDVEYDRVGSDVSFKVGKQQGDTGLSQTMENVSGAMLNMSARIP